MRSRPAHTSLTDTSTKADALSPSTKKARANASLLRVLPDRDLLRIRVARALSREPKARRARKPVHVLEGNPVAPVRGQNVRERRDVHVPQQGYLGPVPYGTGFLAGELLS